MNHNLINLFITYLVMNHNLTSYGLLISITKNWPISFLKFFMLAYFLLFSKIKTTTVPSSLAWSLKRTTPNLSMIRVLVPLHPWRLSSLEPFPFYDCCTFLYPCVLASDPCAPLHPRQLSSLWYCTIIVALVSFPQNLYISSLDSCL